MSRYPDVTGDKPTSPPAPTAFQRALHDAKDQMSIVRSAGDRWKAKNAESNPSAKNARKDNKTQKTEQLIKQEDRIAVELLGTLATMEDTEQLKEWINACGFHPDQFDDQQMTPLMYAAISGNQENMAALMDAGANCFLKNDRGETALSFARVLKDVSFMENYVKNSYQNKQVKRAQKRQEMISNMTKKSSTARPRRRPKP